MLRKEVDRRRHKNVYDESTCYRNVPRGRGSNESLGRGCNGDTGPGRVFTRNSRVNIRDDRVFCIICIFQYSKKN